MFLKTYCLPVYYYGKPLFFLVKKIGTISHFSSISILDTDKISDLSYLYYLIFRIFDTQKNGCPPEFMCL